VRNNEQSFGYTNQVPMYMIRITVVLLCLWGALDAATLKRGVKGGALESYYCLPIDTMSEVFSEKYRKNYGEYDHLAIRFDQSWGNPSAFFHAVGEALGQNTTWQREGFFLVFDTEDPIESIEHRLGKYRYPGELEMVIPVRQQPIPKEQLVLYETLPNEYLTVTEGISFNHIKEFWESSISWSLVEAGLSKSRKQQEIVALLDHQGHPLSKEWSEAYLKKPDKTPGIGLLIRLEGELFIDGKVKYLKAHLVVRHDMSPILRLSGLSTSIFTYSGFMCWEGRFITDYCINKTGSSIFGYDASDLMVTMKRKAEDIRFVKKPNPLEWEDDPEFAGIEAQIRILKKSKNSNLSVPRTNSWDLMEKYLPPVLFLLLHEYPIPAILGLFLVLIAIIVMIKNGEVRKKDLGWFLIPTIYFLFFSGFFAFDKHKQSPFESVVMALIIFAHFLLIFFSLMVFIITLLNTPPKRKLWQIWFLLAVLGIFLTFLFMGIAPPLAFLVGLFSILFLITMSLAFIIHGIQWLLQRWPNKKGLTLALINALGVIELMPIALLPLSFFSSGGATGLVVFYYSCSLLAVVSCIIFSVIYYFTRKREISESFNG
jgi:hypothetical protein